MWSTLYLVVCILGSSIECCFIIDQHYVFFSLVFAVRTMSDSRFEHASRDPRFLNLPKQKRKFEVDSRFKRMFSDDSFKMNCMNL